MTFYVYKLEQGTFGKIRLVFIEVGQISPARTDVHGRIGLNQMNQNEGVNILHYSQMKYLGNVSLLYVRRMSLNFFGNSNEKHKLFILII